MNNVNLDRFSEPPIRREKPEVDEIAAYKQRRDMELEESYRRETEALHKCEQCLVDVARHTLGDGSKVCNDCAAEYDRGMGNE